MPLPAASLGYDKPLCASLAGFTLHAATRAGALDPAGRERLLRYVLRPPIAYENIERRPEGLVRIAFKRAFADGTAWRTHRRSYTLHQPRPAILEEHRRATQSRGLTASG